MNTVIIFTSALSITACVFAICQVLKKRFDIATYLGIFLMICGILFSVKVHAYDPYDFFAISNLEFDEQAIDKEMFKKKYFNKNFTGFHKALSSSQQRILVEQMDKCEKNAKFHFELARDRCWWLPNIDDRVKARECFTGGFILCTAGGTPQSKIISAIIYYMGMYGLACIDEWNFINDNLMKSQAWWESYEFYKYAIENG